MKIEQTDEYSKGWNDAINSMVVNKKIDIMIGDVIDFQGLYFTEKPYTCLLYTSPSPRDGLLSRMPSSA